MATSPMPMPPQGGPPQGASPAPPAVVQIIAGIAKLAQMLGQVFPGAAPMADEIQNQVRMAQSKIAEGQSPAQPQAPPV